MYGVQSKEAVRAAQTATGRTHQLLDKVKARKQYEAAVTPTLTAVIINSCKNGMDLINPETPHKAGPEELIPSLLNKQALEWLKTHIGWAATQTTETMAQDLSDALAEGFNAGESINQIAARIQQVFTDASDYRAQMIARTEILGASNQGNILGYKESGVSRVEWLTARDERTCDICQPMDGDIENIDDAPPLPASTHPACRCIWLPVIS
jgi:SPP1 gp7 family putative phage head morphogenesis protein